MKAQALAELHDSAEDLLTSISSFGSVDSDTLRKEIYRLSMALIATRDDIPNYDSRNSEDEILPEAEAGDSNVSLTPSKLGQVLSRLNDKDLKAALSSLGENTPIQVIDKRTTASITLNIIDVQKIYQKQNDEICTHDQGMRILGRIIKEYNPRLSVEQQCKNICKEMSDPGLNALSMFG
jgi:hypothetical protein